MQEVLEKIIELQKTAQSSRKKGDALRKAGREETATEAFRSGLAALSEALRLLKPKDEMLRVANPPLPSDQSADLRELVEIYGVLGGMHQRLGALDEALASYESGASLEERFGLASTYNRLNAVKLSLLLGRGSLESLRPRIQTLAKFIEASLRDDKSLSDRGWAWADLGDCLALLGRTDEASRAYATFVAKAEIKSPERTLDVSRTIAVELESRGDPDAARLMAAIGALEARLVSQ
jgi:tetratricopeptide (TPR) repeat protein